MLNYFNFCNWRTWLIQLDWPPVWCLLSCFRIWFWDAEWKGDYGGLYFVCKNRYQWLQRNGYAVTDTWNAKELSLESGRWFFFLNFLRQHLYFCCFCNVTFFTLNVYPFFSSKLTQFHMWPKVLRPPDCLYTFASYVAQGVKTTPLSLHRNFHGAVQYSGSFFYIEKTQEIRYHVWSDEHSVDWVGSVWVREHLFLFPLCQAIPFVYPFVYSLCTLLYSSFH